MAKTSVKAAPLPAAQGWPASGGLDERPAGTIRRGAARPWKSATPAFDSAGAAAIIAAREHLGHEGDRRMPSVRNWLLRRGAR